MTQATRVTIRTVNDARDYLSRQGVLEQLRVEDDKVVQDASCRRCGGSGYGHWYQDGGVCYECRGANTIGRVRRVGLVAYARAERQRETARLRKQRAAAERHEASQERQRDWCEANGHGRLTFDELNEVRAKAREEKAQKDRETCKHVGTVKERGTFELELEFATSWDGYYGTTHLYVFRDQDGNKLTWKTGRPVWVELPADLGSQLAEKGDRYLVTGTVKAHSEYKGTAQTELTRCKVQPNR